MKKSHAIIAVLLLSTSFLPLSGHSLPDDGLTPLNEYRRPKQRQILQVPNIGNFQTLKCDLHMHTVFSDGLVWPTIRVQEAWQEGLDVIAITDHIEYRPHQKDVITQHNRPYELAKDLAQARNILLIQGSELTRTTPPGHFNAVFIKDASGFLEKSELGNPELDMQAIDLATAQNAFIFWNHPGWRASSVEGSYEWLPFIEEVYKEGKLHGIEVINGFTFHRKSLDWALAKGLAPLGSSDIHNLIGHEYDMEQGTHRSMSLVFVTERSPEGVREALDAGRSVAWSTRHLAGHEKWIRALYAASVSVGDIFTTDDKGNASAEISNSSDLYFELERVDSSLKGWPATLSLNPHTTKILKINKASGVSSAQYRVTNAFIGGDENLVVEISL